jgi:hypothetical protein
MRYKMRYGWENYAKSKFIEDVRDLNIYNSSKYQIVGVVLANVESVEACYVSLLEKPKCINDEVVNIDILTDACGDLMGLQSLASEQCGMRKYK